MNVCGVECVSAHRRVSGDVQVTFRWNGSVWVKGHEATPLKNKEKLFVLPAARRKSTKVMGYFLKT